jgi:type IV pilus assembly protein PilW
MKRMRGFSMVELMVAVTLALFVSIAVISVFVGSRSAYQATSGTAALTDGGRFALDFIENSVRNSGFMACSRSVSQTSQLNPGDPLMFNFAEALGGYEAAGTSPLAGGAYTVGSWNTVTPVAPDTNPGDWLPNLDSALAGMVVQGNDVLVVRSSLQNAQPVYVTQITDGAPTFTVTTQGGLLAGEFAVISDCADSLAMVITNAQPSGGNEIITHGSGSGTSANSSASFLPMSFQPGSQVTAVDTVVYYIGKGQDGDGALFAADLYDFTQTPPFQGTLQPKELVPDIEAMQVLYGIDTTGTQAVSEYVTADHVTEFNNVMSVKVAVLAASNPEAVKPPAAAATYQLLGTTVTAPVDSRSRQVFEVTIAARNALN